MKYSFLYYSLIVLSFVTILCISCRRDDNSTPQGSYPIDSKVFTTVDRTIDPVLVPLTSPVILPNEVSKYALYGYGVWQYGAGKAFEKRMDLMPSGYTGTSVLNNAKLLRFFAMTDIHITDKESPAQGSFFGYKGGTISAYSPIMLYTTQVLDAAVQTINALHKQNSFDFGIALGDLINNNQYNELRWFIDIFDGKNINPDSGVKNDPIPGPNNDYQDEFKAAGLDKSIKWYTTLGNHDHFWMGIDPVNDYIRQTLIGDSILKMGNIFTMGGFNRRDYFMGVLDGNTLYGDVIGAGPVGTTNPQKIAADPNRRSLSRQEWIGEFFKTSSSPIGHGFSQTNVTSGFACYSFEPKSNMPIKVIVLDDTQSESDQNVLIYGYGSLDKARYDWLVSELDKGQTEGKLMIISAHIPIGVETPGSLLGWWANSYISDKNLIAKLNTYPNLLLWISGHRHLNTVTALKSPDVNHPELGFWEVETRSLREFPQQFRTIDIVRNSDNTVSIFATDVDPSVKDGSFAAISRSYALGANQIFKNPNNSSYNAELVKQLSPEMQIKMKNYGTPMSR